MLGIKLVFLIICDEYMMGWLVDMWMDEFELLIFDD